MGFGDWNWKRTVRVSRGKSVGRLTDLGSRKRFARRENILLNIRRGVGRRQYPERDIRCWVELWRQEYPVLINHLARWWGLNAAQRFAEHRNELKMWLNKGAAFPGRRNVVSG